MAPPGNHRAPGAGTPGAAANGNQRKTKLISRSHGWQGVPGDRLRTAEAAFVGPLGHAPDMRQTRARKAMAVLNLAVDEGDEATTWVKVLAFEANAEACRGPEQGTKLYAEGRLKLESWEGRDGVQRSGLTVLARVAQPIGAIGRRRRKTHRAPQERRNPAAGADDGFDWARGDPIPDLVP